ncbi:MAG: alpha/beta hydrolase [Pseudomonadota bacterium]
MTGSPRWSAVWLIMIVFALGGCAVMDRDIPPWNEYERAEAPRPAITLSSASYGAGSPVLLVHGFGASSYSWRNLVQPLSQQQRVITLDLKGAGASPKPRDDQYSVYEQARLVRDFVVSNQLDDVQIVGHSFGGAVAIATSLLLAAEHPDMQKSLVLIDSMAYPQRLPYFINVLATPLLGPIAIHVVPDRMQVKQLLDLVYYDDALITDEVIDNYTTMLGQPDAKYALLQTARQIQPPDLEEFSAQYNTLTLPTLIVWSRDDAIIPLAIGERLHEEIPNSELHVLSQVGHAVQEEAPQLILPMLTEFLRTQRVDE